MSIFRGRDVHTGGGWASALLSWVFSQTSAPGPTRRPRPRGGGPPPRPPPARPDLGSANQPGPPSSQSQANDAWRRCVDNSDGTDDQLEACDELLNPVWTWDPAPGPVDGEWIPRDQPSVIREFPEPPTTTDDIPFWVEPGRVQTRPRGEIIKTFVAPKPETLPTPVVGAIRVGSQILARIVLGSYVFWPNRTADDDVVLNPDPLPIPRGPTRRPRVGRPRVEPIEDEEPWGGYRGPIPDELPQPGTVVRPRPQPRPRVIDEPLAIPKPAPVRLPKPKPLPRTWTLPSLPFDPLPLLPLVPLLLREPRPRGAPRPTFQPSRPPQPEPFQFAPLEPGRADPCEARQTRRKRKPSCTNPIVSKRTRRDGRRVLLTITREIKCQSSRKKLRSPRVR